MARVIRFHEVGGPEVLRLEQVEVAAPGAGEVRVQQKAIGVNFADLSLRAGRFPAELPVCPGSEAAGIIDAVGQGVTRLAVGDRVAYGGSTPGAYATHRVVAADIVTALPDELSFETAAGMMSAGLTAGYLLRLIRPGPAAGDPILLTAAAGGVGQILAQWAKALDLTVIGVVGAPEKVAVAQAAGCDHVLLQQAPDLSARIADLTGGRGVAVAYDSVGADTFEISLGALRRRGTLVSFGAASGPPPALDLSTLGRHGSLYVTRPALFDYIADPAERAALTDELIGHVVAGRIAITVRHRYPLADAATAHADIEARRTTGSVVLLT